MPTRLLWCLFYWYARYPVHTNKRPWHAWQLQHSSYGMPGILQGEGSRRMTGIFPKYNTSGIQGIHYAVGPDVSLGGTQSCLASKKKGRVQIALKMLNTDWKRNRMFQAYSSTRHQDCQKSVMERPISSSQRAEAVIGTCARQTKDRL